ncbi:type II toxin-antitoxin system PemK/MazF family toxin [Devosia sp. LjRoot3]
MVARGDIWLATLDPTVGSEIQKTRPVLVVSPDSMNDHLRTVIIVPLTSGSHPAGFRIPIHFAAKDGLLLLDQTRAIDKRQLKKKMGTATDQTLHDALAGLQELFAP